MDGCGNRHWQSDEGGRITSFVGKVGTYKAGRQADRRDRQGGGVEAM